MASGARLGGSENIVPAMPLPPQIYNGQQTHLSIMIQTFGSPMFRRLRRITHTVFCTGDLPPTKPCDLPPRSPPGHTPRGSFLPPPRRDPVAEAARQGPWPSCCRVGSGWRGWMEGGGRCGVSHGGLRRTLKDTPNASKRFSRSAWASESTWQSYKRRNGHDLP